MGSTDFNFVQLKMVIVDKEWTYTQLSLSR